MSPKAQRIAIAEACGWSDFWVGELTGVYGSNPNGSEAAVPDYINDLNAMHEAEKMLDGLQKDDYSDFIKSLAGTGFYPIHAPAAQRAEAFLRTLGKWRDGK